MAEVYQPRDTLYLWSLDSPRQPRLVGHLALVNGGRGVALEYGAQWLQSGYALSEDLPLRPGLAMPAQPDRAAGAVDDARPDRWGERVIRRFEPSARLSILEHLLFAGDDRWGSLGVSLQRERYVPWRSAPAPDLGSLEEMAEVVRRVLANEPVEERQHRLIRPGVSLGGARPKSLLTIDDEPWLVKFSQGEDQDTELIEHATMTLAAGCAIVVATTRALRAGARHAVAIKRFDRTGQARVHAISANVALRAAGEELGYPQLAQLLRRLSPASAIAAQQEQLFRRMVFNILMDNTDDHEKNHSLLRQADGNWLLAPAYDVVPSAQGLGYQALDVAQGRTESTIANAMASVRAFGLKPDAARRIATEVAAQVNTWKEHFQQAGVSDADIAVLAQYIDGARLGGERRALLA